MWRAWLLHTKRWQHRGSRSRLPLAVSPRPPPPTAAPQRERRLWLQRGTMLTMRRQLLLQLPYSPHPRREKRCAVGWGHPLPQLRNHCC